MTSSSEVLLLFKSIWSESRADVIDETSCGFGVGMVHGNLDYRIGVEQLLEVDRFHTLIHKGASVHRVANMVEREPLQDSLLSTARHLVQIFVWRVDSKRSTA